MKQPHDSFNEDILFQRKDNFNGYKFCPFCGSELERRKLDGHIRLVCSSVSCDFIYYQNPVPAAGAIIVEEDKILLVKRAHPPKIGYWCIPAGFMEWNEHPRDTAIRELKEETGLDIKLSDFFQVYSGNDDPRSNALLIIYLAERIGGEMAASDDALEVKFFSFEDLPPDIAFEAHKTALKEYDSRFRQ